MLYSGFKLHVCASMDVWKDTKIYHNIDFHRKWHLLFQLPHTFIPIMHKNIIFITQMLDKIQSTIHAAQLCLLPFLCLIQSFTFFFCAHFTLQLFLIRMHYKLLFQAEKLLAVLRIR